MGPTPSPNPLDQFWGPNDLDQALLNFGTIAFLIGALVEVVFLVHYIVVAPAFKSWIGWMFVLRSVSFLLSGLAILLGRVLGPNYAARPYVTVALFSVVMLSAFVTYGTFLFERYKNGRRRPTPPRAHRLLTWTRRAMGVKTHPEVDAAGESLEDAERRLRLVEDRTA